jgi:hypothetical protein
MGKTGNDSITSNFALVFGSAGGRITSRQLVDGGFFAF